MWNLVKKMVRSPVFGFLIRFLAGLASAIVVISGFLFFLGHLSKEGQIETNSVEEQDEEDHDEEG